MCDFCEHDKKYRISKGWQLSDGVLFNTLKNSHCLVADDADRGYYDSLKINFCPLCGRKLSEEAENE